MDLRLGDTVPLFLKLETNNTGKFPQAKIYDHTGTILDTKDLTHSANGAYRNNTYVMPNVPFIRVDYLVFDDAGHTIANNVYFSEDVFNLDNDASQSSVNAINIANYLGFGALKGKIQSAISIRGKVATAISLKGVITDS